MIKTAKLVEELREIGIEAPPRPQPPFPAVPTEATAEEIALDRAYQSQCVDWIEAVARLHSAHFPQAT